MINIAIFASGSGTNAENIIKYFSDKNNINISLLICNKSDAFVLKRAKNHNIPAFWVQKKELKSNYITNLLISNNIDYIVLAGFLLLIPESLIDLFPYRIINIHPALLPKYGGKGMYGDFVHQEVIKNKEKESGITIHFVNKNYDEGEIIFQAKCKIETNDTPKTLAQKIHKLEYQYFPIIIEKVINNS